MCAISQILIGQMLATLTALCSVLADVSANTAAIEYRTVAQYGYECLDVLWSDGSNNVTVQQYACHGATNQRRWFVYLDNDSIAVVSIASGKCLDIPHGDTADGVIVQQNTCHYGLNQQ